MNFFILIMAESTPEGVVRNHFSMPELFERMEQFSFHEETKKFVKWEFRDWKDGCHVLPNIIQDVEDSEGDIAEMEMMKRIYEYAHDEKQPMFVVANVKALEDDWKFDAIIVHRRVGVKILQVVFSKPERLTEALEEAERQVTESIARIRRLYERAFPDSSFEGTIRGQCGYACFPCNFFPVTLQEWKQKGVLTKDECKNPDSFKEWWKKFIFSNDDEPLPELIPEEKYLDLLSMCVHGSLVLSTKHRQAKLRLVGACDFFNVAPPRPMPSKLPFEMGGM
ncbi:unnamed protein product [Darwinula stevensoni]|uniref:Uncharacterized protein n=1 Tax=Darwinula stevensoni TaxID=69355 RepID=A0A7R9FQK8_9CRUS|nr:unnamed protein product [Darwinula stevensoni]CAG0899937.1 unnamed protein product [Darwinula stevensoni]